MADRRTVVGMIPALSMQLQCVFGIVRADLLPRQVVEAPPYGGGVIACEFKRPEGCVAA